VNRIRSSRCGFTLIEVMLALAVLALALMVLVKGVYGNIAGAQDAFYMGVATDLARGKMYDLEEELLQEGYQETEQEITGDFSEEGWPAITWKARIEPVELPSYDVLMGLSKDQNGQPRDAGTGPEGEGEGEGESSMDRFQSSALGGMLGMLGMGGGGGGDTTTASEATTGGFIQMQYELVKRVLKESIRKITLTVSYDTGMDKQSFDTVLYVTDAAGMQKVLQGLGAEP
jgi:general secretion pathway protein I